MSTLTLQCQKLRNKANDLRERFTFTRYGGAVSRDSLAYEAASLMEDAADTIENLRNRLTETCHMTLCAAGNDYARYRCSECEQETMTPRVLVEGVSCGYERPTYCVNCGRKVV